jgi:hypothetical protein
MPPRSPSLPQLSSTRPPTGVSTPRHGWITDRSGQKRGEKRWPPMGRSGGHQWGLSMAASGEIPMATVRCGAGSLRPLIKTIGSLVDGRAYG